MELEDMRQAWERQVEKLDDGSHLDREVLRTVTAGRAETGMRRLSRLLWAELVINAVAAIWLGSFLADNLSVARYALPAAGVDVLVIALLMAGVRQLVAISRVDFGQPVLVIQQRLESLRAERIRATMGALVAAPLVWIPMLVIMLKGFLGVDAYAVFSPAWLVANVVFGLLVVAVAVWASRRYRGRMSGRMSKSSSLRWLTDNLAGRNLRTATAYLQSLAQFEAAAVGE